MALVIDTTEVNGAYSQVGALKGVQYASDDYDAASAVSDVYKTGGRELLAPEIATQFELQTRRNFERLPAWFSGQDGVTLIDSRVADLVREWDAESHQLCKLTFCFEGSAIARNPWYVLNVWRHFDTIDEGRSGIREVKGFDRKVRRRLDFPSQNVVLSSTPPESVHLWRDAKHPAALLLSDGFADALEAEGLLGACTRFRTRD